MAYVKSVSFGKDDEDILDYCVNTKKINDNFSDYVKDLIRQDKEKGFRFTKEQEKAIIELIKKYAPAVKEEDIKFDDDKADFLGQF